MKFQYLVIAKIIYPEKNQDSINTVIDIQKSDDKENKKMVGRFRLFIQNMPNLTDD